jgi:hypothetical protein
MKQLEILPTRFTPGDSSAVKICLLNINIGLQVCAIHPSWTKNAIELREFDSSGLTDFRNYKRSQPMHL